MPRKPRLFVTGAIYHVYCRVARGEFVFDEPEAVASYIHNARRVAELDGWSILAWCLMGNHHHLVVQTGTVPLWRSMARLQGTVARDHNRRKRCLGRLWQSRYKARVIYTNEYFRQVVAYVHLNPVAAGVVSDPAEYPNSGHAAVLGRRDPVLVDAPATLAGFDGGPGSSSRSNYLAYVRAVADARWLSRGVHELPWWVGAADTDEVASPDQQPVPSTFDGQPIEDSRRRLTFEEFISRYEAVAELGIADLARRERGNHRVRARVELTTLAVARYRLRSCDIARQLDKHPTTVHRWLLIGLQLERSDVAFRAHIDRLDIAISNPDTNNATMRYVAP
jgi:REP element-mobilizing transposase RayT